MSASPTTPTNPASTLMDVIECVRNIFALIETTVAPECRTVVLTNKIAVLHEGAPPRVLFVPEVKGEWGDPPTGDGGTGYVAGITHGCDIYVWGEPNVDPFHQWSAANALARRTLNALLRTARGRIGGGDFADPSPQSVSGYGEDIHLHFTYVCGVQRDQVIWALPSNAIAPSPPDISRPPGSPATTIAPLSLTTSLTET